MILRDVGMATYRVSGGKRDDECAENRKFEFQTSCVDDLYGISCHLWAHAG